MSLKKSLILCSFLVQILPVAAQNQVVASLPDNGPTEHNYFPLQRHSYQHPLSNSSWRKAVNNLIRKDNPVDPFFSSGIERIDTTRTVVPLKIRKPDAKETTPLSLTGKIQNTKKESIRSGVFLNPHTPVQVSPDEPETRTNFAGLVSSGIIKKQVSASQKPQEISKSATAQPARTNTLRLVSLNRTENNIRPVQRSVEPVIRKPDPVQKTALTQAPKTNDKTTVRCNDYTVTKEQIRALISKIAREEGIDEKLAEAIAIVESNLGGNQISKAGAVGIMQLMPETAKELGVTDRCHPEQNIRGGLKYFKKLLDEFDSPLLALGAYNAGSRRVYERRGIPTNPETVGYIVKVLNHWLDFDTHLKDRRKSITGRSLAGVDDMIPETPTQNSEGWVGGQMISR